MTVGAPFLTDAEAQKKALQAENTRRSIEQSSGIAYRLFNTNNSRSLVSVIQANTTTPKSAMTAMISLGKQVISPLQNLANLNNGFNYFAFGNHTTAFAAGNTTDQYFKVETAAMPDSDLQLDVLENANIIENIKINGTDDQKRKLAHYDECLKTPPPSKIYFSIDTQDKGDGTGHSIRYFTYFPEKNQELDQNKNPINDNPDSPYNKYIDCKILFLDGRDFNNPAYQLAIRYRTYVYNNSQLDLLDKLSSSASDESIYANPSGGGNSTTTGSNGGTNPGGFIMPVDKKDLIVSQCWGHGNNHDQGGHPGIDLAYTTNKTPDIYAVADGTVDLVKTIDTSGGYGNMVYIKHSDTLYTLYAHLQEAKVQQGDQVKQGQVIGIGDSTGQSTGGHLHFEVRSGSYSTQSQHNPVYYIPDINTLGGQKCKTGIDERGP
jgi:murein DD-endopeptidase MepM/ murein hydrolase activator NlpD